MRCRFKAVSDIKCQVNNSSQFHLLSVQSTGTKKTTLFSNPVMYCSLGVLLLSFIHFTLEMKGTCLCLEIPHCYNWVLVLQELTAFPERLLAGFAAGHAVQQYFEYDVADPATEATLQLLLSAGPGTVHWTVHFQQQSLHYELKDLNMQMLLLLSLLMQRQSWG